MLVIAVVTNSRYNTSNTTRQQPKPVIVQKRTHESTGHFAKDHRAEQTTPLGRSSSSTSRCCILSLGSRQLFEVRSPLQRQQNMMHAKFAGGGARDAMRITWSSV